MQASSAIWEVAEVAIAHQEDPPTRETAVRSLGLLANTPQQDLAIGRLVELSRDESWQVRQQVAYALKSFSGSIAQEILAQLKQDSDHRVIGAVLEEWPK
jgi:HEAT repeat protein